MLRKLKAFLTPQVIKWGAIGLGFTLLGIGMIKVMTGGWHWPYLLSTFVEAELCNVLRFLALDRWVFDHPRPTWRRLWQYHAANALGFAIWYGATNAIKQAGVYYLLAPILGTMISVGVNFVTNFLWIWRKPKTAGN